MLRFAVYRHLANEKRYSAHIRRWRSGQVQVSEERFDLDSKQLLEILTRFSESLPENYRIVFIQHKLLDRPLPEVAEQLGVSPRTAEAYVAKLMRAMRQRRQQLSLTILLI
jgi:RNA polymerase sigma-70 factor (ECF subfamily)